ncbi:hypothetical protein BDR05DRAFT_950332 [Suillus weaverae]|nr:hypothetical protein BDR05DRAFT_950332 [Suillus weaverae]
MSCSAQNGVHQCNAGTVKRPASEDEPIGRAFQQDVRHDPHGSLSALGACTQISISDIRPWATEDGQQQEERQRGQVQEVQEVRKVQRAAGSVQTKEEDYQ